MVGVKEVKLTPLDGVTIRGNMKDFKKELEGFNKVLNHCTYEELNEGYRALNELNLTALKTVANEQESKLMNERAEALKGAIKVEHYKRQILKKSTPTMMSKIKKFLKIKR